MAKKKNREQKKREKQRRKPRLVVEDLGDGALWGAAEPDEDQPELMTHPGNELPPPFVTEKAMRGLFGGGGLLGKRDKPSQAQDLAYEAMETRDPTKSAKLCTKALALDPNCVDAFMHMAQLSCDTRDELIKHIRMAVEVGERGLGGPAFIKENRGYFWGLLETRPYMRARAFLAQLLVEDEQTAEAIAEYEELLKLNPSDNQGLRYPLLGLYLERNDLDGARRLFKEYEDEGSAVFAWALVLERFLADDEDGAAAALKEARSVNEHVEKYLTGRKRMPKQLPGYYGIGDENEAIICVDALGAAWKCHRAAAKWLRGAEARGARR